MKEYNPIKRSPSIVSFSKDHHFGLLLVWKIRQGITKGISAERIADYVLHFFKTDLKAHFSLEEKLLFSKLPVDDILRIQAEKEHQLIYELISAIEKNKEDIALLTQIGNQLEKHIRFEERELFNYLQTKISEADLALIATKIPDADRDIDKGWNDAFWENNKTDNAAF